jgi:hypothetical protein
LRRLPRYNQRTFEERPVLPAPAIPHVSRYFLLLAVAWLLVMTWRIYPQFKDAVRVEGQLSTVEDYIDDTCRQRVGPAAETCIAETRETARHMLRREQGKSILLIEAPILCYLILYVPFALWRSRRDASLT